MTTIRKTDTGRITVGAAKRLIVDALPEQEKSGLGGFVDLVVRDGEVVGVESETLRDATASEAIDLNFVELCRDSGFEPRMKINPARGGYELRPNQDDEYMLTHSQFVKLAESYSLKVEIGSSEEVAEEAGMPAATRKTIDGPLPLTTGDIAFCFDGLRWDEKGWKKPLGDKPKWLDACLAIPGKRGESERRWNPVLIAAVLLRDGHVSEKSVRARFQTKPQLKPWLDAWRTYEADYLDTN